MKVLLTGGAACGKSSFAEQLISELPRPYFYIATMDARGVDGAAKVAKHRKMRAGRGFTTFEQPRRVDELVLPAHGTILFEDIPNLAANEMFTPDGSVIDPSARVAAGLSSLIAAADNIVIVTNEIGSDRQAYTPETRTYIRALGLINQAAAHSADYVYEFVCGIPRLLKGPADSGTADRVARAMRRAQEAEAMHA